MSNRRPRRLALFPAAALVTLAVTAPGACALELRPGLWDFRIRVQAGLMGDQTLTSRHCLHETALDPALFTAQLEPCRVDDVRENARSLDWTFLCGTPGRATEGGGSMTVVGDTIRGRVTMTMPLPAGTGSRRFTREDSWAGRRVGECG